MGHHVGETAAQFLAQEPALAGRMEECRASEPKAMTPEQIHALSKQDLHALAEQVYTRLSQSADAPFQLHGTPDKRQLEDMARRGLVLSFDRRMPDEVATCHALLALTGNAVIHSLPHARPWPVTWRFSSGLLQQIDIDFHGADFSEVSDDVSSKTGKRPDENAERDTPNLYGGTIRVYRKATWLTPELFAVLESDQALAGGQMYLSVISRAAYDTWARTHARKSTLD